MSAQQEARPKSSAAGRYLFLFLLGLVLGVIGTVMAMRAWNERRDHFPESVMNVQGWHIGQLKDDIAQNRCGATDTLPHLRALRTTGDDLEAAFPDLADDQRFKAHAAKYRGTLDAALASPPLDCAGVEATLKQVGDTCKDCHQDFRS